LLFEGNPAIQPPLTISEEEIREGNAGAGWKLYRK
jgi:hypothetical protein